VTVQRTTLRGIMTIVGFVALGLLGAGCNEQPATTVTPSSLVTQAGQTPLTGGEHAPAEPTLPLLDVLVTEVEPIHGYGDYSAYSYAEVPWDLVTAAEIACMRDQGWPIEAVGATGMSWTAVPPQQNEAAQIAFAGCVAGLNLPEYGAPSGVEIESIYRFWVDTLTPCLESEGYDIPDPPSVETFVETYPGVEWSPWRYVTDYSPGLEERCPQSPYDHHAGLER